MNKLKSPSMLKKVMVAAMALAIFTQCSEEEELASNETPTEVSASTDLTSQTATSLTVSGVHTLLSTEENCKTCTYVVPANTKVVDGSELGLKPGSVICLNAALNYGSIEFVNLEGSEENPIVIANWHKESAPTEAELSEQQYYTDVQFEESL